MTTATAVSDQLERQFREFHQANPHVFDRLRQMAHAARRRGHRRIGMKMLFEVIRWEHMLKTEDPHGFKLNNNYTAFYARLLMQRDPTLDGMFETRGTRRTVTP